MSSNADAAIDLERFELRLFPNDPPPSVDLQSEEGRLPRLGSLLELHPVLRQALREGCVRPQIAFAASRLSPGSQDDLAAIYQQEGELSSADVKRLGGGDAEPDGGRPAADGDPDGSRTRASRQLDDDE